MISSSIAKTSLVYICLRCHNSLLYCIWIFQYIGIELPIILFTTVYHLGRGTQILWIWICQSNLIPWSKLRISVKNKPSLMFSHLPRQIPAPDYQIWNPNQIPCVFTLCSDLVTPLSKTKKCLFYMGRARWDHLNIMKEGGFPKPYHSWLFLLDEQIMNTSSIQSPYLQTEVFMSGLQVFFSVAMPTKAVLSCFTVPVLLPQLLMGLCCGGNQRTVQEKIK